MKERLLQIFAYYLPLSVETGNKGQLYHNIVDELLTMVWYLMINKFQLPNS